jgi:ice-binding like protein
MQFRTRNFAALPLAVFLVVAVGCGASMKSPTALTPDTVTPAGLAGNLPPASDIFLGFQRPGGGGSKGSKIQAPALGAAASFAVLAGSTVTNTGATSVTGNLGVSPGSAVTGFPPGILKGARQVANPASARAMADLTRAYNDVAGRTLAPVSVAGNIGGRTLAPGLYKSTSSLEISSGDLTLDAKGNGNAVFLFQVASTLTTTSGRAVILSGGAKASNIFWQVGSSATLGTTSAFKGTIMADQSISLNTGARLNGRALARIGAVTLAGNTIVLP